ncbi:MAG: alcohol dehydrogenase catalytic domain-containing protein, partial [Synechococcales cyanobacterium RU_4_20]|nr:alcohol dehydrogenase catalytic domain-containing protein [Synechococcales cyanobacterium RU_4_20]
MKAIGVQHYRPTTDPHCFELFEVDIPEPQGRELLVRVRAVGVNPVDIKLRSSLTRPQEIPRILGWDAAGIVEAIGPTTTLFQAGDEVYYAGSITRPGCNAEYQLVDERIVGHKPRSLTFEQAAALPLTSITAWEALFEQLQLEPSQLQEQNSEQLAKNRDRWLLLINGAGGVGSIAIQLAKQVAGIKVIATASRP